MAAVMDATSNKRSFTIFILSPYLEGLFMIVKRASPRAFQADS
jgi:hypothetical protein